MKALPVIALLVAAACGDNYTAATQPDAEVPHPVDAASLDAAPKPVSKDCNVGNLPASRTITISDGDPVPAGLVNEVQDIIIGHSRKPWRMPFYPIPFATSGDGTWTTIANPAGPSTFLRTYKALGQTITSTFWFVIPLQEGDRMLGLEAELFGDGVVDAALSVQYFPDMHSAALSTALAGGTILPANVPSGWALHKIDGSESPFIAFVPFVISGSGLAVGSVTLHDPNLCFGTMTALVDRMP
jgi:hypothetical protein